MSREPQYVPKQNNPPKKSELDPELCEELENSEYITIEKFHGTKVRFPEKRCCPTCKNILDYNDSYESEYNGSLQLCKSCKKTNEMSWLCMACLRQFSSRFRYGRTEHGIKVCVGKKKFT